MLSWIKKRFGAAASTTFKQRTADFWRWYSENAAWMYESIEAKRSSELQDEVAAKVDGLAPTFGWVFGPGANGVGHSFTLSADGSPGRQLLTEYWKSRAPEIPGWTFHASKQPNPEPEEIRLQVGDQEFHSLEFWLAADLDHEEEQIDVTVWHPRFATMEEQEQQFVSLLLLDEALGEFGNEKWISSITIDDERLAHSFPLKELRAFVEQTVAERGWSKGDPGERVMEYTRREAQPGILRKDIEAGATLSRSLVEDWTPDGLEDDELEGTGAEFVFLVIDLKTLPGGDVAEFQDGLSRDVTQALVHAGLGFWVGGAIGVDHMYIDLMILDGENSIDLIERVLRERGLPTGTRIEYFAKERRKRGGVARVI